jgi:hypothetical protein
MLNQVPIEFEFRKTHVEWSEVHARITGWWKRSDGSVDGEKLKAEIIGGDGRSIEFPLERLPDSEWEQCISYLSEVDGEKDCISDDGVAKACSAFEPQLLIRSDKTYNVKHVGPMKPSELANPWDMREDFQQKMFNCKSALAFLNKWGSWDFGEFTLLVEIIHLQQTIREGLMRPPEQWNATDYSVMPRWQRRPQFPFLGIVTDKCKIALCLTVTFDLLRKAKFKICASPQCAKPFEVKFRHDTKYCSRECGHRELVRRNRKAK